MTFQEAYRRGRTELEKAGIETAAFDAVRLFQYVFGLDRQALILRGGEDCGPGLDRFQRLIRERAKHEPLQYLLGEWEFMDFSLAVGKGVLIPREETELLVYTAAQRLKEERSTWQDPKRRPKAVDLCAGTGAVGLGIASLIPDTEILCAELYPEAMYYLRENIRRTKKWNVIAEKLDILCPESPRQAAEKLGAVGGFDLILSNPPYINTGELSGLQQEVQREPQTALDGGEDGVLFYRAIAQLWLPLLSDGGVAAVEVGETQGTEVKLFWEKAGLQKVEVLQDFNGLDRVVIGQKGKKSQP